MIRLFIVSLVGFLGLASNCFAQETPGTRNLWLHNGSKVQIETDGPGRTISYVEPRPGIRDAGGRPGDVLFSGRSEGGRYVGTAYIFSPKCGRVGYPATGDATQSTIVLKGRAPRLSANCKVMSTIADTLVFNRVGVQPGADDVVGQPTSASGADRSEAGQAFERLPVERRYEAQMLLGVAGYYPFVSTDQFSKRLYEATLRFQSENGLAATGALGIGELAKLQTLATPLLQRWGLAKVQHPSTDAHLWVPLGLGLQRSVISLGYSYQSAAGVQLQYSYLRHGDLAATYRAVSTPPTGMSPGYMTLRPNFFVVSYGEDGGSTTYIRCEKVDGGLLAFRFVWPQDVELHGERLATLISDLFRSSTELNIDLAPPMPYRPAAQTQPDLFPAEARSNTAVVPYIPQDKGLGQKSIRRVALVVGNSAYRVVPALANPGRDADLVGAAFRSAGIDDVTIVHDADRQGMIDALNTFAEKADNADWAIIYYAGHGIEMDGRNFVIPVDAKLESDRSVPDETISLDRMMSTLSGAKKLKIVVLDACRNNPFHPRITVATRSIDRGLSRVEPDDGTLVVYAAKEGTVAKDGSGTDSPFAAAFAKRIVEPGMEINMALRYVRQDVLEATGRQQEPFMYGSLPPTPFILVPSK